MRITWDLHHFEQQERQRTEYTGDFIVDGNTQQIIKKDFHNHSYAVISFIIAIFLIATSFFYFKQLRKDYSDEMIYGIKAA